MNIHQYIEDMKLLQSSIICFIDNEDDLEENKENLLAEINKKNILNNQQNLKTLLYLISNISNNHCRTSSFIGKFEQIILYLQKQINDFFSDLEIFQIFKNNKRILLFLIENQIIKLNISIIISIINDKYEKRNYLQYFFPEIKSFIGPKLIDKYQTNISTDFYEKRRIGENDNYICELIRNDSIDEFIAYVNKTAYTLDSTIPDSIFETNEFLLETQPTLIEYAAFFGSVQILKYLKCNNVKLTESLWMFSAHCEQQEMIELFKEYE